MADDGAAIYLYSAVDLEAEGCSFAGNSASEAGGAYYAAAAYGDFRSNAVVGTTGGDGIHAADTEGYSGTSVAYNAWSDNLEGDAGGYFWVEEGQDGNVLVKDAGFVDLALTGSCDDDLHLLLGSPLIDAGDPDLEDPDGSVSDIGAYVRSPTPPPTASWSCTGATSTPAV